MKNLRLLCTFYLCAFTYTTLALDSAFVVSEAWKCCESNACRPSDVRALDRYISSFDEGTLCQEEAQASALAKNILNGTVACAPRSARAPRAAQANTFSITCPTKAYNAAPAAVSVTCTISANSDENIGYVSVGSSFTGSRYTFYKLIQVYNGTERTRYSGSVTITLPRYIPNGVWQVTATLLTYDFDQLASATSRFTIKKTTNDVTPPVLNSISVTTPWGTNPCGNSNYITVAVSDNLSGIASVIVGAVDTVTYKYAVYQQLSYSPAFHGSKLIYVPQINAVLAKNFTITVTLTDAVANQVTYTSANGRLPFIFPTSSSCSAGQYAPPGTSDCVACPANLYSNAGAFACCACPSSTSLSANGACVTCPNGYTSPGGSSNCTMCPAGSRGYGGSCSPCTPGYISQAGASSCSPCPSGYTSCVGSTSCTKCAAGTYGNQYSNGCIRCPAGSYSTAGLGQCSVCPPNTYSGVAATSCTACPAGKQGPAGSNNVLNCM